MVITGFWNKSLFLAAIAAFGLIFHAAQVPWIQSPGISAPGKGVQKKSSKGISIPNHTSFFKATFWPRGLKGRICGNSAMAQFQFDCRNLAEEWDGIANVRSRIRGGGSLVNVIQKSRDASISQCVANMDVLLPMVHRLYACGRKLPEVPRLREECAKVYSLASKVASEDMVDDDSWELRKMVRFVKRKAQREEVTQDPCFCDTIFR